MLCHRRPDKHLQDDVYESTIIENNIVSKKRLEKVTNRVYFCIRGLRFLVRVIRSRINGFGGSQFYLFSRSLFLNLGGGIINPLGREGTVNCPVKYF